MACIGAVGNARIVAGGFRGWTESLWFGDKKLGIKLRSHLQFEIFDFQLVSGFNIASFAPGQDPEGNVTIVGDVDKFGISDHPKLGTAIIQSLVFDGFSHVHLKKQHGIITLW